MTYQNQPPYQQQQQQQTQTFSPSGFPGSSIQVSEPNAPLPDQSAGFMGMDKMKKQWDSNIPWFKIPERQAIQIRIYGQIHVIAQNWLPSRSGKNFPLMSLGWNNETGQYDKPGDPILELFDPFNATDQVIKSLAPRKSGLTHAIIRGLPLRSPQDKPWRPMRLPMVVAVALKQLSAMNKVVINGVEYTADVADDNYGRDIQIYYNPNGKTPQEKYLVQLAPGLTPLTREERAYKAEAYNWKNLVTYPTREEVLNALTSCGFQVGTASNYVPPSMFPSVPPPPPGHAPVPSFSGAPLPQQPVQTGAQQWAPAPLPPTTAQAQDWHAPLPPPAQLSQQRTEYGHYQTSNLPPPLPSSGGTQFSGLPDPALQPFTSPTAGVLPNIPAPPAPPMGQFSGPGYGVEAPEDDIPFA
jgi:hypothetical protein